MLQRIREDLQTVFAKDPAAKSTFEVLVCYPGLHAIWLHRVAHYLWKRKRHLLGRLVSHTSRWWTGVEIHPGAVIGRRFFIDHGMGVVIGETTEIGDDVLMYKGCVLGGTSMKKAKRHPTISDGVVIGSNAVILGPVTIGANARVGSGAVVVKSVPANTTVVGVPGRVVRGDQPVEGPTGKLDHGRLPDPVVQALSASAIRIEELEERIRLLETAVQQKEAVKGASS
ncbi:MAG: serine O-acetyltransferase [Anaerolineae bacterium]|nr:serine O-acetyltransferase [Anaerolineae bacterium]